MTLTSAEVVKMQKHNADLVRENATLTRDNAELRRQVAWIENISDGFCRMCQHSSTAPNKNPCNNCRYSLEIGGENKAKHWELSVPPDA